MKKLPLFAFLVFMLTVASCTYFDPKTTQNEAIDKDIRTRMAALNKKLFKSIMSKDIKSVKSLMSPALLDSVGKKVDTVVNTMADAFHATDYRVLDEYYTTHSSLSSPTKLTSNKGDVNFYQLEYRALNPETYTVIMVSKNLPVNCCVMAIYGKYRDTWQLHILEIGEYDMFGKTAPEYYATATQKLRKADTIDAAMMMTVASELSRPAGEYLKYNNVDDMKTFYSSTIAEANATYHFPITVKQVKTQPKIFAISPQLLNDGKDKGIYPIIKYKTAINLKDTVALKAENLALQKVVGTLFKGITEDKKCIIYHAYNQVPDGKTLVNRYGFIQRLP